MTKSFVTGVAGFIGSTLAETILKDGGTVVGIDSLTDYYSVDLKQHNLNRLLEHEKFRFIKEDIAHMSVDTVEQLNDCSTIYHQAGQPGVRGSWKNGFEEYVNRNVVASQRLLESISDKPSTKFVYASSSSIYGNSDSWPCSEHAVPRPFSPYGVTKLSAEHLVSLYSENFGLNGVSLRYFTVYGPRQRPDMAFNRFINAALTGGSISVFGDGEQIRDFTYIDDIVAANLLAAEHGKRGGIYNLSGGSNATVNDVLGYLEESLNGNLDVQRIAEQPGDVRRTGGDSSLAAAELGWNAVVSLQTGLQRQFDYQASELK